MKLYKKHINPKWVINAFVLLLNILLIVIITIQVTRISERNELEVSNHYENFQRNLDGYITSNRSLVKGLKAYIQMNGVDNLDNLYNYVSFLIEDNLDQIRNLGIIEDTTILINYPLEGNEASIGVDLSQIEGQSEQVSYVKTHLASLFQGPVDLVQGGRGYVQREPIVIDGTYWGMASMVIYGEAFDSILDGYSLEADLHVMIQDMDNNLKIVYGDKTLFDQNFLSYTKTDIYGNWLISFKHRNSEVIKDLITFGIMVVIYLLLSFMMVRALTNYLRKTESTYEKNLVLNEQVIRDSLTGVCSRTHFINTLFDEVNYAINHQTSLALIFCDIDHFKEVNDQLGHAAGDDVLYHVANTISTLIRKTDMVTRWGGEEFLIMLTHLSIEDAFIVAEKMRQQIETNNFGHNAKHLTASFGVAMYDASEYIGACIHRADAAMYRAKENGRNRVVVCDHSSQYQPPIKKENWDPQWSSGHPLIDEQHEGLIELTNAIIELSYFKEMYDQIPGKLDNLFLDLKKHFRDEEKVLDGLNWDGLRDHRRIHASLLEAIIELTQGFRDRHVTTEEFVHILLDNIVGHMEEEDMKYYKLL